MCIIGENIFRKLGTQLQPMQAKLEGVARVLPVKGQFIARVTSDTAPNEELRVRMLIVEGATDNLLSRAAAKRLNLISRINMFNCDMYQGTGLMDTELVKFKVASKTRDCQDFDPYSVNHERGIAIPLLPKVIAEPDNMKSEDIIEPVTEATEWCAPIMPVPKAGGKKVRIYVDLSRLNRVIVREKYPSPMVDAILHKLSKSQVFTRLDARSGYWQIPLDEESSLLMTFITPVGRFKFKRLPKGWLNAENAHVKACGGLDSLRKYQWWCHSTPIARPVGTLKVMKPWCPLYCQNALGNTWVVTYWH